MLILDEEREREYEYESNRLLQPYTGKESGIYQERHLVRDYRRWFDSLDAVPWIEVTILESESISLDEVIDATKLTMRQRRAVRLMRRGYTQKKAGIEMGLPQHAVSQLLHRAYERIRETFGEMEARIPTEFGEWLWREEQRYKRRLIYRRSITLEKN